VQSLQIELIVGLDGHEAHVLACYRFGDRLGVEEVVLVRFQKGFYKLRGNQPHIMALAAQCSAEEVRAGTGFHADERVWQVRTVGEQLFARELLLADDLAALVECNQVESGLAQVNADGSNLHAMILRV